MPIAVVEAYKNTDESAIIKPLGKPYEVDG